MKKSVLITGGSGLLGSALTELLLQKDYHVSHLGRTPSSGKVKSYRWSVKEKFLDPKSLLGVDTIIHLAGAGVAEKRWTLERKTEILESRTKSTTLLFETLRDTPNQVKTVLAATAIGYYGLTTSYKCSEDNSAGNDFLAQVCQQWEESIEPINGLGVRLAMLRLGVVLSNKGGALLEMAKPVKWGVGAPLGSGQQWVSWIHIDDICRMFLFALENDSMKGIYNAVAPAPATNRALNTHIAKALHRPLWLPPIPAFVLNMLLGEMYQIVVNGANVRCDKIKETGFIFSFSDSKSAIENLLIKPSNPIAK